MHWHGRPRPDHPNLFSNKLILKRFILDGIITLVDAVHAQQQLDQFTIAQSQIGYADRILLTKTDVAGQDDALLQRLQHINARAPIYTVVNGEIDLSLLFNVDGFMLNDKLTVKAPLFRFVAPQQKQRRVYRGGTGSRGGFRSAV